MEPLNRTGTAGPEDAGEVAAALEAALSALVHRHCDTQGNRFDYGALPASREFAGLRSAVDRLDAIDPGSLGAHAERLAFWLNVYNALLIHAVAARRISTSIRDADDFFDGPHYRIGGEAATLDVIEHGILRRNRRKYMGIRPVLGSHDRRGTWAIHTVDPRIHFALYTAARSTPVLRVHEPRELHEGLDHATREYLDGEVRVDTEHETVMLPAAFRWYRGDFGNSPGEILDYVARHLPDDSRRRHLRARGARLEIRHTPYDWSLNDRYAEADILTTR